MVCLIVIKKTKTPAAPKRAADSSHEGFIVDDDDLTESDDSDTDIYQRVNGQRLIERSFGALKISDENRVPSAKSVPVLSEKLAAKPVISIDISDDDDDDNFLFKRPMTTKISRVISTGNYSDLSHSLICLILVIQS